MYCSEFMGKNHPASSLVYRVDANGFFVEEVLMKDSIILGSLWWETNGSLADVKNQV
jgi:hypothetical protein